MATVVAEGRAEVATAVAEGRPGAERAAATAGTAVAATAVAGTAVAVKAEEATVVERAARTAEGRNLRNHQTTHRRRTCSQYPHHRILHRSSDSSYSRSTRTSDNLAAEPKEAGVVVV